MDAGGKKSGVSAAEGGEGSGDLCAVVRIKECAGEARRLPSDLGEDAVGEKCGVSAAEGGRDLYAVLGLKKDFSVAELGIAYRNLALKWHPDRFSSSSVKHMKEAKEKFQEIQRAYSVWSPVLPSDCSCAVLSDPNKRLLYDVGAYDDEDDEDSGFGDFIGEMAQMMSQMPESVEKVRQLFVDVFEPTKGQVQGQAKSRTCSTSPSSSPSPATNTIKEAEVPSCNVFNKRGPLAMDSGMSPRPIQGGADQSPAGFCFGVSMNTTGGTMETPVSSSLGAMGPLLRKLDLLLAPNYPIRSSVKQAIQLLKEDLKDINDNLVEQSMVDSPNHKAKYWMHEARELSYDVEDAIDTMMLPRTATDGKAKSVHGHKVAHLKIRQLPNILKSTRISKVAELRTLLWEASERYERYQLDSCMSNSSPVFSGHGRRIPLACDVVGNLVGIDGSMNELTTWLTNQAEPHLKIICIVGPAGVGKTSLAKELYCQLGSQFECRAFIRLPRKPHMSRVLEGILCQIQLPKDNSDTCSVANMIDKIWKHLQDKRYFIVIDGLWEARVWNIINSAFPKGHNCSRIMITCEVKDVAAKFCGFYSVNVWELKPLGSKDSEKLFHTMLGSNVQCHDQLKEVTCRILRACAGLPLATIAIAGLLASQPDNSDIWHNLLQYCFSDLANLTVEEMLKGTVNLCYNSLPQDLKTCLLYLTMYPEGCTIRKVDLLKQWMAEGFISPTTEEKESVAENYFAELVNRGMIQPEKIIHNGEVISCTVHHIVFDVIMHKSREASFTAAVDYSQTTTEFFMKIYRLSLHFSCAQYATKLEGIRLSQIRSLSFFGLLRCMPSVAQLRLLRVLILEFWDDNDECISLDLSRISGLVLLRYLKISSHLLVELPSKIQELTFLETLEIDARVWSVPDDIVHLPGLLHLSIQDEAKLPDGIGRVTSLQTLQYFDLSNNSEDNTRSLCELINLRDLHITCSTALSDAYLNRKFVVLAASLLKLTNLRSLTVAPGAISMPMSVYCSTAMLSTPMFLQRLEMLPPICIFSRLPEWVGKLQKLRVLKIVVRVLLSSDIDVLTGLPGLTVLSLYIRQPNTKLVVFSSGALPALKYFKYTCGALFLAFQEKALPNLERLKLRFNVHKYETYYHMNSGIENLLNLKDMTVKIGAAHGAKESDKKAAESAIESAIRRHPRFPIYMNIRRIDWVEED